MKKLCIDGQNIINKRDLKTRFILTLMIFLYKFSCHVDRIGNQRAKKGALRAYSQPEVNFECARIVLRLDLNINLLKFRRDTWAD